MVATTTSVTITPATVSSLAISPAQPGFAVGTQQQFVITATLSDGTTQDVTSSATWSSSNPAVVSVDANGVSEGMGVGSATVTGTLQGQSATAQVNITSATLTSIAITPSSAQIPLGMTKQFTATGTYSDGSTADLTNQIAWSSSDPQALTIDENGVAKSGASGSASISATKDGVTATTDAIQVTPATVVSVAITPQTATIANGTEVQFTAIATLSDGTTQDVTNTITWTSSNPAVVSIDANGQAHGVGTGPVMLTATIGDVTASTGTITGSSATISSLALSPTTVSIAAGATQQMTATETLSDGTTQDVSSSVTWTVVDTSIATVSPTGLATGIAAGATQVQATYSGQSATATITVSSAPPATLVSVSISPDPATMTLGTPVQLVATATYSDGSTTDVSSLATWLSSDTSVATIANGVVTGHHTGNATITLSYGGVTKTVSLTVGDAVLQSLAVAPLTVSLADGTKQQFTATGTYSDGSTKNLTKLVTWTSTGGVSIGTTTGLAEATATGPATITATSGMLSASATATVTPATITGITVTPNPVVLPAGGTVQITAVATLSDGSSQDVTGSLVYNSSNPAVATIDADGKVHAVGEGSATITITPPSGSGSSFTVTVSTATLQSIAITPANLTLSAGTQQQLTAVGTFSDGSTQDLTSSLQWSSSDTSKATVSSTGVLTSIAPGPVTITATNGTVSQAYSVTVSPATISTITLSPANVSLAAGQSLQMAATAVLSDGTQQDVTSSAHWSVTNSSAASVSNSDGSQGLLTALASGSFQVQASINGVIGSAVVTVGPATLSSITASPNPLSLPAGLSQTLTVTGHYSDSSTAVLTGNVTWTSSNPAAATVTNQGVVQAIAAGATTLTATAQGQTATVLVTVTSATVSTIAIIPASPSVALGGQQQLTATATYSDTTTENVTSQVQWTTSDPSVATVSSTGVILTHGTGSATITGTLGGVTNTIPLTVTAATLQSIAVESVGGATSFPLGLSLQLKATGHYSDGTTQDLTNLVNWSSQSPTVGIVSATGIASGITTGNYTAQAAYNGVNGTVALTVAAPVLQSIDVTPANAIIVKILGGGQQYTATGHYSDGSTQDITNSVQWSIPSGIGIGTISPTGRLTALALGTGTIQATSADGSVSGSTGVLIVSVL